MLDQTRVDQTRVDQTRVDQTRVDPGFQEEVRASDARGEARAEAEVAEADGLTKDFGNGAKPGLTSI